MPRSGGGLGEVRVNEIGVVRMVCNEPMNDRAVVDDTHSPCPHIVEDAADQFGRDASSPELREHRDGQERDPVIVHDVVGDSADHSASDVRFVRPRRLVVEYLNGQRSAG